MSKNIIFNKIIMTDLEEIKSKILSMEELKNCKIFLFWSRAKWNYTKNSDYDIWFIWKQKLELQKYFEIKRQLEELPYCIDLVDFNRTSKEFRDLALKNIIKWK